MSKFYRLAFLLVVHYEAVAQLGSGLFADAARAFGFCGGCGACIRVGVAHR